MSGGELEGRVVAVAGGSRGIGRAVVLGALERGACVAYCSRAATDDAGLQAAAPAATRERLRGVRADVSREAEVEGFFDGVLEAFGRVDAAVYTAGMAQESLLVSLPAPDWDALMATNLSGGVWVARRAAREFLRGEHGGTMVLLGSLLQGGAPKGGAAYGASKAGLVGLARALAWELGSQGVRAHVVVPGFVETEMTAHIPEYVRRAFVEFCPQRRLATPEDIASVVLFLLSERAAGLNGQILHATGGFREIAV